ncbi:peptidase inhibitor family I36 protein [Streptomyces sp. NPDC055078]
MRKILITALMTTTALLPGTATAAPAPASAPAPAPALVPAPAPALGECPTGALCLWEREDFSGERWSHELYGTEIDSCVALPPGTTAESLANRTGRPVTTYQSGECAETGEFQTYPGDGTWVPRSPYRVRAFTLRER